MNTSMKTLGLFHAQFEKLKANRSIWGTWEIGCGTKFDINCESIKRLNLYGLTDFIIRFRPFIANNEPVNFYHVSHLLGQNTSDKMLLEQIGKLKDTWKKTLKSLPTMKISTDGKEVTPEENLKLWLYGEYFHLDQHKRDRLTELKAGPGGSFSFIFLMDTLKALFCILEEFDLKAVQVLLHQLKVKS